MCTKNGKPRLGSEVAIFRSCACPAAAAASPRAPAARQRQHGLQSHVVPSLKSLLRRLSPPACVRPGTIRTPPIPVNLCRQSASRFPATFQLPAYLPHLQWGPAHDTPPSSSTSEASSSAGTPPPLPPAPAGRGGHDAFFAEVGFHAWNVESTAARPGTRASPRPSGRHPHRAELIAASTGAGSGPSRARSRARPSSSPARRPGVPLYAITKFSGAKFAETRERFPFLASAFRDVVVSGDEACLKPEPEISAPPRPRPPAEPPAR